MNDPHVVRLRYKLITGSGISYKSSARLESIAPEFDLLLEDGLLNVELKAHHASKDLAIAAVGPTLRAWEIATALRFGPNLLRFDFQDADVIDRDPPPPGPIMGSVANLLGDATVVAVGHSELADYPKLPNAFLVTPLVELLFGRMQQFEAGKEPLAAMGYACLTALETSASGRRDRAAHKYKIAKTVLNKLAVLTGPGKGGAQSARKFKSKSADHPHTTAESDWIIATVKMLVRRVAEHAHNSSAVLPQITMADLPNI